MVIYRAIGFEHNCPGATCVPCTLNYSPPPPQPELCPVCCEYIEEGVRVRVVVADLPAPLTAHPKRPGAKGVKGVLGSGKVKRVELTPVAPARRSAKKRPPPARPKRSPAKRKPASKKARRSAR